MSDNTEEYERYTQIAKERPAKVEKQKVTSWQLVLYEGGISRTTLSSKHVKIKRKNERGKQFNLNKNGFTNLHSKCCKSIKSQHSC